MALLFQQCAPALDARLTTSLVRQESSFNPYAIGLDGKAVLQRQPRSLEEAIATVEELQKENQQFSVGLAQIHVSNIKRFGLTWTQAFDPCTNLKYGQAVLIDFHQNALKAGFKQDGAVFAALRGYNSGDIHAKVSNGYATEILGRVTSQQPTRALPPLPPLPAVLRGAAAPAQPIMSKAVHVETNRPGSTTEEEGESLELFDK